MSELSTLISQIETDENLNNKTTKPSCTYYLHNIEVTKIIKILRNCESHIDCYKAIIEFTNLVRKFKLNLANRDKIKNIYKEIHIKLKAILCVSILSEKYQKSLLSLVHMIDFLIIDKNYEIFSNRDSNRDSHLIRYLRQFNNEVNDILRFNIIINDVEVTLRIVNKSMLLDFHQQDQQHTPTSIPTIEIQSNDITHKKIYKKIKSINVTRHEITIADDIEDHVNLSNKSIIKFSELCYDST